MSQPTTWVTGNQYQATDMDKLDAAVNAAVFSGVTQSNVGVLTPAMNLAMQSLEVASAGSLEIASTSVLEILTFNQSPSGTIVPPAAGTIGGLPGGLPAVRGGSGYVEFDSFTGTDDQKFAAAMAYARAQPHIPAIRFPARDVFLNTGGLTPYSGMKLEGPAGSDGPKNLDQGSNLHTHRVVLNVGVDANALFNGSTGVWYNITVRNMAFQDGGNAGAGGASQFWYQPTGPTAGLYACEFHSLCFYGMKSVFGSSANPCAMTQVSFTGHWEVIGFFDTQFNMGGSDCNFWVDGYLNIGTSQPVGAGVYYILFGAGLAKTKIGLIYATPGAAGWGAMQLAGAGNVDNGVTFFGGIYEGTATIPATVPLINITGGMWTFYGTAFNYVASGSINGVITQSGGVVAMYSPTYSRLAATAQTFPFFYQTGGTASITGAIAGQVGENCYVRWSNGETDILYEQNKSFVGGSATGMLAPCQVATQGSETYTIASGSVTQITGTTINGYTPAIGDRVLIWTAPAASGAGTAFATTTLPANGIYVVTNNVTNLTLARSLDMSGFVQPAGLTVWVEAGGAWTFSAFMTVTTPTTISAAFVWGTNNVAFSNTGGLIPTFSQAYFTTGANFFNAGSAWSQLTALSNAATAAQTLTLPGPGAALWIDGEQFCTLTSAYTLTSQTAAQKLFNSSATGAVTLGIGTFFFECLFTLSSLNVGTSSVFGFAFGGGATISGQLWESLAGSTALATPTANAQITHNTAANVALVAANTTGIGWARIKGKLRVSVAGTVIPQVSLNTAAAAIVGVDSFFRVWSVGLNTVTTLGTWS